ncbi:hypothetical protein [Streptomyces afghaniensis]|uniref:hypothetical protein n=1 Tax=Streptomyces afghaniensis TaxID=66865 RepID=UPI0037B101AC
MSLTSVTPDIPCPELPHECGRVVELTPHLRGLRRTPKGTGGGPHTSGPADHRNCFENLGFARTASRPVAHGIVPSALRARAGRPLDTTPSPLWSA